MSRSWAKKTSIRVIHTYPYAQIIPPNTIILLIEMYSPKICLKIISLEDLLTEISSWEKNGQWWNDEINTLVKTNVV